MKINRFLSVLLIVLTLTTAFLGIPVYAADESTLGLPEFPDISSNYVVLMDADSKEVLYSSNPDTKCYPASTTKLLTALITLENRSLDDTVTFSENAVNSIEYGDANASVSVGETLTIEQALYCLLLRSANEVAYGLAEDVAGNVSSFAALMNSKAESIGAVNTHFTNASGLTDQFHYTTPYDMALIAVECFNSKELMKIAGYSGLYTIGPTNKSGFTRYYKHRFEMLEGGTFEYKYACGGKTGYTDAAGNCLVSFAEKDGLRLVCVIFNSGASERYTDTIALFNYYLNNYSKIYIDDFDACLSNDTLDLLSLTSELNPDSNISLGFKDGAYLLVPNAVEKDKLTTIVTYSDSPAYMGEENGFACISFFYEKINVGTATIYIESDAVKENLPGTNGVVSHGQNNIVNKGDYFYINIWFVAGGIIIVIAITIVIISVKKSGKRKSGYFSRKLRF